MLKYRLHQTAAGEDEFRLERDAFLRGLANRGPQPTEEEQQLRELAMADGRQALKVVRQHAGDWGIQADRIGILGFSAGGVVTMGVVMDHDADSQPNFAAPIYGGNTGGAPVPDDAPPLFILCASDDTGPATSSVNLYAQWRAANRPAELHLYEKGGHGFGMTPRGLPIDHWIERYGEWLDQRGLLKRKSPQSGS